MSGSDAFEFYYNEHCRTREAWKQAGPSDIPRLNAELWAARNGIAGMTEDGGYMLYWRAKEESTIQSQWWPNAKALNKPMTHDLNIHG